MSKNSYYVSKSRKKKETRFLELEKLTGYKVTPKVQEDGMIGVSKIVFVNDDMAEKVIRKKVDKKIEYLLKIMKEIDDNDDGGDSKIKKSLVAAEKLRLQLINNYVKYLGNTYHTLTLKKIDLIIEELKYKLYVKEFKKQEVYLREEEKKEEKKEGRRGR